jgi:hypothetical protein
VQNGKNEQDQLSKAAKEKNKMPDAIQKWMRIRRHLTTNTAKFYDNEGRPAAIQTPKNTIYISKTNDKFRLKSHLDWAWYSPKTLAAAIDADDLDLYYQTQLSHQNSDPNIWRRWDEEQDLKSYYAARVGRASLI